MMSDHDEPNDKSTGAVVIPLRSTDRSIQETEGTLQNMRMLEALLFASAEPLTVNALQTRFDDEVDVESLLEELQKTYAKRGVNLIKVAGGWAFRTADDLSFLMQRDIHETRKLSRAALETLAIIAYHQPMTRAEIEEIRGVSISKGTLDVLMEAGWVRMRGRRRTPGRPVTYGTTTGFLDHFMLEQIGDLPGFDELKGAGLLDISMPANFKVPIPDDNDGLADDEDPLEDELDMISDLIAEDEEA